MWTWLGLLWWLGIADCVLVTHSRLPFGIHWVTNPGVNSKRIWLLVTWNDIDLNPILIFSVILHWALVGFRLFLGALKIWDWTLGCVRSLIDLVTHYQPSGQFQTPLFFPSPQQLTKTVRVCLNKQPTLGTKLPSHVGTHKTGTSPDSGFYAKTGVEPVSRCYLQPWPRGTSTLSPETVLVCHLTTCPWEILDSTGVESELILDSVWEESSLWSKAVVSAWTKVSFQKIQQMVLFFKTNMGLKLCLYRGQNIVSQIFSAKAPKLPAKIIWKMFALYKHRFL